MARVIAAVSTIRGDADIAPLTVRHMFAQGVAAVLVAAGDDTAFECLNALNTPNLYLFNCRDERHHEQQAWTDKLARTAAGTLGADWIIPFDADEFWYAPYAKNIRAALEAVPTDEQKLTAKLWHHNDWLRKVIPAEPLPKVAYRWSPDAHIAPGNHDVTLPGGLPNVLAVRHYQYRSFEQFCAKVRERNRTLAPEGRARGDGVHHTRLENASELELRIAWSDLLARATVHDPIPARAG